VYPDGDFSVLYIKFSEYSSWEMRRGPSPPLHFFRLKLIETNSG
jgi:hypothetical protein